MEPEERFPLYPPSKKSGYLFYTFTLKERKDEL